MKMKEIKCFHCYSIKPPGNTLSSLEGLPPLGLSTNGQRVKDTTQKNSNEVTSDIKKALLNLELGKIILIANNPLHNE